jgi:uncharacterized repeat protein (TIGR01451 family)
MLMKQFYLLFLLFSFTWSNAQFFEDFEGDTFPPAGWTITSNLANPPKEWSIISGTNAILGNKSAFIDRYNIGLVNTSEDWLITPPITVSEDFNLYFFSRTTLYGNQGTFYEIRISTSSNPNDLNSYVLLHQFTENTLNPSDPGIYDSHSLSLQEYGNQTIHIAFVRVYFQPSMSLGGDRWILDNVLIESQFIFECLPPNQIQINNLTSDEATLQWNSPLLGVQHQVYLTDNVNDVPDNSSDFEGNSSQTITFEELSCNHTYYFYIRTWCQNNEISTWSQPYSFTTPECGVVNTPYVTVDSDTFTPEQILNDVILNESCGEIENVITQGPCGVGYFNANESDFPFQEGLIIRSGQAHLTQGSNFPNGVSSTCSFMSDPELIAIMQSVGQSGTINDVSYVKFDITPTSNTLSFNFIFASNEYGTFQCNFSDVFGFILTDLTTNESVNIALVPGTNTPISTTTIRDSAYNQSCSSVNSQFFSTFNVGAEFSSINMRGYTMPMTAIASVIPNHQYSLKLSVGDYLDTAFDSAVFIEGGSMAIGNQCREFIQVITFLDENNNGIKDNDEPIFSNGNLNYEVNNSGEIVSLHSNTGSFIIYPENQLDSFDFNFSIYPELDSFYNEPISFQDLAFSPNGPNLYYIPIVNSTPYNDVSVALIGLNQPVAGFNYINRINYTNNGIVASSGTLTFENDPLLTIVEVSNNNITNLPNGFSLNYENLMPFETRSIQVKMNVPPIPAVSFDDLLTNSVSISTTSLDADVSNNLASLTQAVVASYDPNDKNEAHGEKIVISEFSENDYLYYTIRFQNTGTTHATFVRVEDVLDTQLNPESLRMLDSSHSFVLERVNNQLIWRFDDIFLVPQIVDENASIGFVHFKIKPYPGIEVGDIISNTADIYFDYNPVIVTNTFYTEFVEQLSVSTLETTHFQLYPNQAKEIMYIQSTSTETLSSIRLFNMLGKEVLQLNHIHSTATQVNLSGLPSGIYLMELTSEHGTTTTKKLVKQ